MFLNKTGFEINMINFVLNNIYFQAYAANDRVPSLHLAAAPATNGDVLGYDMYLLNDNAILRDERQILNEYWSSR